MVLSSLSALRCSPTILSHHFIFSSKNILGLKAFWCYDAKCLFLYHQTKIVACINLAWSSLIVFLSYLVCHLNQVLVVGCILSYDGKMGTRLLRAEKRSAVSNLFSSCSFLHCCYLFQFILENNFSNLLRSCSFHTAIYHSLSFFPNLFRFCCCYSLQITQMNSRLTRTFQICFNSSFPSQANIRQTSAGIDTAISYLSL